ncbi:acyl-CoA carboxylase epsilon subunit-like protein [Tamaricihabitans halophyticus]|uniref:Acyl-CoA carboxylase epsilon subunit-like protein n=1 Tax=Tamaricihabitans halophyticus TaxID=1262583 RepID=A0A4R2R9U2_9PSEU|nr:acyl-CoA carboxylase subunit epsilon [Tamaricihabitans halophyticus]TCP56175.1 acyl-CoA carboxylase epsilon subunit-like protein [Tamaricihabitans halophyticus]
MTQEPEARPMLRVVRGNPDDAELAALTAVVAGLGSDTEEAPPPRSRSRWADRAALVRGQLRPGPGAWRAAVERR